MRRFLPAVVLSLLLGGCAAYKELSPKPELSPAERGYIELKDKDEFFQLDKDGKYYIKFPKPEGDQYTLVLRLSAKRSLDYYLTATFDDGKGEIQKIPDQTAMSDSVSAFAINAGVPGYFWVIDSVKSDVVLWMTYRYVPTWRFTFENRYESYKEILANNKVERTTYNSIDEGFDFSNFPFSDQQSQLESRSKNIKGMKDELASLERIFPANIANSRDTAYTNYITLRNQTNDELQFQENYASVLSVFKKERDSRGNTGKFLQSVPAFTEFFSQRDRYRKPIVDNATEVMLRRLKEAPGYYDEQLRAKNDTKKITFAAPLEKTKKLYEAIGSQMPADLRTMMGFVDEYNSEASAMQSVSERFNQIERAFSANPPWLSDAFYVDLTGKISEIKGKLPESKVTTLDKYGRFAAATMLDSEIKNATTRANASETLFRSAQQFVQQLNANSWPQAEGTLREIYTSSSSGVTAVNDERTKFVRAFENEFFTRVKQISQQRVDAFVKEHEAAIDNVPALYNDSAFVPVYEITFSSAGEADAQRKRAEVQNYIDKLKYNDFPAASIRAIYRDFTRNINDRGVERARAIVGHGKYYKGDDKQLRSMVNEVDPMVAKWIVKPKEYRKQYVLPTTTNTRGVNEYVFRVVLKIPSEAQFPVFEINIKLPREVAEKAGSQSWYESIKINRTLIKNEGRYTITAPTAGNEYESQVSPVQMDKSGNNVLEVRFKYPAFKVFEVSTMAQVPIIRKN